MSVTAPSALLPGALAGLKRDGGGLLVVGDRGGHSLLCQRLFGDPEKRRQQIAVRVDRHRDDCLCTPADAHVVSRTRATPVSRQAGQVPTVRLDALVLTAIDRRTTPGLDPGELRVCLGSLDHLLETSTVERVASHLSTVLERVTRTSGMVHAHLPGERDDEAVRRLEPLFDAVIEVDTDSTPRHRWHLPDDDVTTDWIPLQD